MDRETFVTRRRKIAQQICEALEKNLPDGVTAVHHPDGIGATGLQFEDGYILIQVEDAS